MVLAARGVLQSYDELWALADQCAALLGPADALTGLVEDAVTSRLAPWVEIPRRAWTLGRCSGRSGELRWRAYGPLVRVLVLADLAAGEPGAHRLEQLGLEVQEFEVSAKSMSLALWRVKPHTRIRACGYLDAEDNVMFLRYAELLDSEAVE
jgi:hypothetical protein